MNKFSWIFLSSIHFLLLSCDNGIRLTKTPGSRNLASTPLPFKSINDSKLSLGLKKTVNLLNQDQSTRKVKSVFTLSYFLIPEDDFKIFKTNLASPQVVDQLSLTISGTKYLKFFINPTLEHKWQFLKHAYRHIDHHESEFVASHFNSDRSVVVWNKDNPHRLPFILELATDQNQISHYNRLFQITETEYNITKQKSLDHLKTKYDQKTPFNSIPYTIGYIFHNKSQKGAGSLSGQIVSEIPKEILTEEYFWSSLQALLEKSAQEKEPLIMSVIKNSKLTSYQFIQKYFINQFLQLLNLIVLEEKLNFAPHLKNIGLELTANFLPSERIVLFNSIPPQTHDLKLQKKMHRSGDVFTSYYLFYRRHVLEKLLPTIKDHDPQFTADQIKSLEEESEKAYYTYLTKHLKVALSEMPSKEIIHSLINTSTRYLASVDSDLETKINDSYGLKIYIDRKKAKQEWLELISKDKNITSEYYVTNHGVYEITDEHITGVAVFTSSEIKEFEKNNQMLTDFFKN